MLRRLFLSLLLVYTTVSVQSAEVYYDQFDWGLVAGNPGELNTAFWSGSRDQLIHDPLLPIAPTQGAVRLGISGVFLSRLQSRSLTADFPSLDYEFHARIRMTEFPDDFGERNAEIAFRSNGNDGYLLTLDGGQDVIRLRRQGGGYTDLVTSTPLTINPGDTFYIRTRVEGTSPVSITASVATDSSFATPVFQVAHTESDWTPFGEHIELIGFSTSGPYTFDVDYFSIGTPGYIHSAGDWERTLFTAAPPEPAITSIGDLDSYDTATTGVLLWSGPSAIRLTPVESGAVRVEFAPDGVFDFAPSYTAVSGDWPARPFTVTDAAPDPLIIAGEEWRIDIERSPLRLVFRRDDGTLLVREAPDTATTAIGDLRLLSFSIEPDDAYYGMGEHSLFSGVGLNRRGHSFTVQNAHQPPSYLIFPFWTSPRGYGVFVDNPGVASIDMGENVADRLTYVSGKGQLRYFVYFADDLYGVLDQHTRVTGRPLLQPRWTLGNIQSRFGYESFADVQNIINGFRTRDIPLDCVVLDLDWFGRATMGNLEFQTNGNWPDPVTTLAGIRSQGIKVIPITEPQISGLSSNATDVIDRGLIGRLPDGVTPYPVTTLNWITSAAPIYLMDFTNPAARTWWIQKHQRLIEDYQFDGFWQDLNEPEGQPADMVYTDGPADAVRNVIGLQMNRTLYEAMELYRPNGRTFIMSRSGFAGMQKYGAGVWSGDVFASWADLERQVPLAASMGLAGVPVWNSDVGGFIGTPSPELYVRWCQFAFFNPVYRPHADHSAREPWAFGSQAEQVVGDLLRLRYRLIPHFYTISRESYDTGSPIMRPLVMDWPDDPAVRDLGSQFLYGPHLLAAPITSSGVTQHPIYLPKATWMDWRTGQEWTGPANIVYTATLADFPILVRTPAIIPLGPVMGTSDEAPLDDVTLRVFLSTSQNLAQGRLYEDDGLTNEYQAGAFSVVGFRAERISPAAKRVSIDAAAGSWTGMPANRAWEIEWINHPESPGRVRFDGASLAQMPDRAAYNMASSGWYYDGVTNVLSARAAAVPQSSPHEFLIEDAAANVGDLWTFW